jgi:hypothetical protein
VPTEKKIAKANNRCNFIELLLLRLTFSAIHGFSSVGRLPLSPTLGRLRAANQELVPECWHNIGAGRWLQRLGSYSALLPPTDG